MWVRTQDKKQLMNCEHFEIDSNNVVVGMVNTNYKTLGIYSTKEKALKVLDQNQQALSYDGILKVNNLSNKHTNKLIKEFRNSYQPLHFIDNNINYIPVPKVFNMPQDNEV